MYSIETKKTRMCFTIGRILEFFKLRYYRGAQLLLEYETFFFHEITHTLRNLKFFFQKCPLIDK